MTRRILENPEEDGAVTSQVRIQRRQRLQRLTTALKARAGELFKQFRILTRAFVHPDVPWYAKLVCGCSVLYIVSPIQLIPNFIPVIGQMDDVLVISLSMKLLKRSIPQAVLDECTNGSRTPVTLASSVSPITASPELIP
jgi:uncharacterized membrane protein YkvA (DUF1232 family)